ncbi:MULTISPECIES: putative type VI secretion system effector [unclassified Acinetobacter]|uniref:putative type VI secretion system effector n=1 Tax=unclassified Acinetobacter TaxID=196816 RepID=UPI0015D131B5|nr:MULTISPECIES: putative type VI secretion system effector [unclassified Acinetobacter]
MYLYDLVKFEGRIEALEIHNGVLNTLGGAGDNLIKSSAILSTVAGSVSLGAQTVFLATQSRLHIQTVVMNIEGKVCVGQFHRALLAANEYVICIAKQIEPNVYELYSVLSPKTGLLHMQIGMGSSVKKFHSSVKKGGYIWFALAVLITIFIWIILPGDYSVENISIWFFGYFILYFIFIYIIKSSANSLIYLSENSEQVFDLYDFKNPQEIYLLTARHEDTSEKLILESIYDYRKVIKDDPYPEDYSDKK